MPPTGSPSETASGSGTPRAANLPSGSWNISSLTWKTGPPRTSPRIAGKGSALGKAFAAEQETALPAALAEPAVAINAPLRVLLPEQVQSLHDHVVKNNAVPSGTDAVLLSVVMSVGAIAGLIANPIVGALSDRTTSPRGRRHPWTFGCALAAALGLAVVATSPAIGVMALGGIINMGYN